MNWWKRWWQAISQRLSTTRPETSPPLTLAELQLQLQRQLETHQSLLLDEVLRLQRLEAEVHKEMAMITRWEERAILAVRMKEDELARVALHYQQQHQETVARLEKEVALQQRHLQRIRKHHLAFEEQATPLLQRTEFLFAQMEQKEAQREAIRQLEQEQWTEELRMAALALGQLELEWEELQVEEAILQDEESVEMDDFDSRLAILEQQALQTHSSTRVQETQQERSEEMEQEKLLVEEDF